TEPRLEHWLMWFSRTPAWLIFGCLLLSGWLHAIAAENLPTPSQPPYIDPQGIPGSLVIGGGGLPNDDSIRARFLQLGGGKKAKVVIIPTSRSRFEMEQGTTEFDTRYIEPYRAYEPASVTVFHTRSAEEAN